MRKVFTLIFSLVLICSANSVWGQQEFIAVQNGSWDLGTTWGGACVSGCIKGVDFPGTEDDVYTNGFSIIIPNIAGLDCNNLFISFDVPSGIILDRRSLTIHGSIVPWDDDAGIDEIPEEDIIQESSRTTVFLVFTGQSTSKFYGDFIFDFWDVIVSTGNIEFLLGVGNSTSLIDPINLGSGRMKVTSGTINLQSSCFIQGSSTSSVEVSNGGILNVSSNIRGVNLSSKIGTLILNGVLNLQAVSAFINSDNFVIGSTGTLRTSFSGANQTQGWWYQSNAPSAFTINLSSSIEYSANANQNIWATTYGNLILNSGGSSVTKTLVGGGNLTVQGDFTISQNSITFASSNTNPMTFQRNITNNGIWATTQRVDFTGGSNQIINGNNSIVFNEELRINKSGGNVALDLVNQEINGLFRIVAGTYSSGTQQTWISGNVINNGTISAGSGTGGFVFNGTTELTGTGSVSFRNLTIQNGATLTPALDNNSLIVTNNFTNNGTFIPNEGTVSLNGTGTRSIAGTSKTDFWNLTTSGGTVNVNAEVDLYNIFTPGSNVAVNQLLTLKSTPGQDAAIAAISGTFTSNGNVAVERYIGGARGYRYMSTPLTNATIFDWQGEFPINGSFTGSSAFGPFPNNPSVYRYQESLGGDLNARYVAFPSSSGTEVIENGRGYAVFMFDGIAPVTSSVRGNIRSGTFNLSLTNSGGTDNDGWHMVANPYPAPVNWGAFGKTNIEGGAAHIYNHGTGNYSVTTDGILSHGQGFFVRAASGGGSISATEAVKAVGTSPALMRQAPIPGIEVVLSKDGIDDISLIRFNPEANNAYDVDFDASRLLNEKFTLSTLSSDNKLLKLNSLSSLEEECGKTVALSLEGMGNSGTYTLSFRKLDMLPSLGTLQLKDNFLNTTTIVDENSTINFTVTSAPASKGAGRFELIFDTKTPSANVSYSISDVCIAEPAIIILQNSEAGVTYQLFKGETMVKEVSGQNGETSVELAPESLVNGLNSFNVKAVVGTCASIDLAPVSFNRIQSFDDNVVFPELSQCFGEPVVFSFETEAEIRYKFFLNSQEVLEVLGNGEIVEATISNEVLAAGDLDIQVKAITPTCGEVNLKNSLSIQLLETEIQRRVAFDYPSVVCVGQDPTLQFVAQDGVTYSFRKDDQEVLQVLGSGQQLNTLIPSNALEIGLNQFEIVANRNNCGEVVFADLITVTVEDTSVETAIDLTGSVVCIDESTAGFSLSNSELGARYELFLGNVLLETLHGTGNTITGSLPTNVFSAGLNEISVLIKKGECTEVELTEKIEITINTVDIQGLTYENDFVICGNDDFNLNINGAVIGNTYRLKNGNEILVEVEAIESQLELFISNTILNTDISSLSIEVVGGECAPTILDNVISISYQNIATEGLSYQNSFILCQDDDLLIVVNNAVQGQDYHLIFGNEQIATQRANGNQVIFLKESSQFTSGSYAIAVSNSSCGSSILETTINVEIASLPSLINQSATEYCIGSTVSINVSVDNSNLEYFVYADESLSQTMAVNRTGRFEFSSPQSSYFVKAVNTNGCATEVLQVNVSEIDVQSPSIVFEEGMLKSTVIANNYQWYLNGTIISGANDRTLLPVEGGLYKVKVINGDCSAQSEEFDFRVLNAEEIVGLNVYPNPVADVLTIQLGSKLKGNVELYIFNVEGNHVFKGTFASNSSLEVLTNSWSTGVYFLSIRANGENYFKRIVKN